MNLTPTTPISLKLRSFPFLAPMVHKVGFLKNLSWGVWLSIALSVVGLLAIGGGILALLFLPGKPISAAEGVTQEIETQLGSLTVAVTGAVKQPGLYTLQEGDRIAQALEMAGGILEAADQEHFLALNLAQRLSDGQQIFIPFKKNSSSSAGKESASELVNDDSLININTADQKTLETLPGIGAVRAGAIIENRPYLSIDELVSKEVVTDTMLTKLNGLISI